MTYPKTSKNNISHFDQFACTGDSVTWKPAKDNPHGLTLAARLECDDCTRPEDSDCYSQKAIDQWHNGDWYYVGIVLSVTKNGITLDDNAASLWGIECNYSARSNLYFAKVCKDLESEALQVGADVLANLIKE